MAARRDDVRRHTKFWASFGSAKVARVVGSQFLALDAKSVKLPRMTVAGFVADCFHGVAFAGFDNNRATVEKGTKSGIPVYSILPKAQKDAPVFMVSADGTARPVEYSVSGARFTFSEWNTAKPVSAPPASQVYTF